MNAIDHTKALPPVVPAEAPAPGAAAATLEKRAEETLDSIVRDVDGMRFCAAWDDGDNQVCDPMIRSACGDDAYLFAAVMKVVWGGTLAEHLREF